MSDCCAPDGDRADDPGRISHDAGCHNNGGIAEPGPTDSHPRVALIGSPNAGKTSVFNALTGLRLKTANYPGVTVSRSVGRVRIPEPALVGGPAPRRSTHFMYLEDLPGTYSLTPISPDEQVVADHLAGQLPGCDDLTPHCSSSTARSWSGRWRWWPKPSTLASPPPSP